ncbi:transcriptional regulator, AraC family [Amycolatopsis marina]|uniref:Transcriptional regulator, AraC family n=1 Tax=Amycolatopsis marina TaxID=490629 RepID=A0A1I0YRP9_9PSEU|nr:AraC family transcriptional regulator [Amycolatopsis marina]SFB16055.1 transcriptional regulator, AraC family [Amycolatopsis marina]
MNQQSTRPLPESCCPALWLWPGQALYLGPSLDLGPHSGSVSCLAVGVDAPFTVDTSEHGERTVHSALIAARSTHRLIAHGQRMAFCYLDPASGRELACRARMTHGDDRVRHGHSAENALIDLAARLTGSATHVEAGHWLDLAGPETHATRDGRMAEAARRLLEPEGSTLSADELSRSAGLSTSRFLHLFREHTGTSFRRYRLWARMLRAGVLLAERHDLTRAATEAGFASPSHFSDSFRTMFGLSPTRLLAIETAIRVVRQ